MSKPIEIVAVKKTVAQPEAANLTERKVIKKAGQPDPEKQKRKLPSPGKRIKADSPVFQNQAIGIFKGHLSLNDEKLAFCCHDGATLPICGIDGKLALWLLAHPAEAFSPESADWIVYPKSHLKTGELVVYLKARTYGESEAGLKLKIKPDTARIKGKLLSVDGEKLIIGVRRNLSSSAFKELATKGMIHGSDFEQFTVFVYGLLSCEEGQFVELDCRLVGDRLVVQTG